ncbi:tRNA pseudouridine(38-40) synthase TruA [Texcoconibacillus texcoconensis]|uniref:tRNA pseudouridine synthase A n=1 Tax=Texcoconibacillus texcoconensis TaxID=1095777 RepID=A0A840QUG9_9BACI|nr:tRNA pseudouridine(38-40) synthase TruA [Texcoconibacillus texcoconensis]MBB5174953.1 tRNA pseudouridine38-40 synthase [Texcoconibacillus texcoconensis]
MPRVKCTLSYDGTHFSGYQVQPSSRTVQYEFERALAKLHKGQHIQTRSSGRTDAGVHAVAQISHFDTPIDIPRDKWPIALNGILPEDIAVKDVEPVADDFDARYDAVTKEYRYRVYTGKHPDVFRRNYTYHLPGLLDEEAMKQAASLLLGEHDFTAFCSPKTNVKDKVRTLYEIDIYKQGDEWHFRYVGSGFLYQMVRILTGTILEVGKQKRSPENMTELLKDKKRHLAGPTVSGQGLYLWEVNYS